MGAPTGGGVHVVGRGCGSKNCRHTCIWLRYAWGTCGVRQAMSVRRDLFLEPVAGVRLFPHVNLWHYHSQRELRLPRSEGVPDAPGRLSLKLKKRPAFLNRSPLPIPIPSHPPPISPPPRARSFPLPPPVRAPASDDVASRSTCTALSPFAI